MDKKEMIRPWLGVCVPVAQPAGEAAALVGPACSGLTLVCGSGFTKMRTLSLERISNGWKSSPKVGGKKGQYFVMKDKVKIELVCFVLKCIFLYGTNLN